MLPVPRVALSSSLTMTPVGTLIITAHVMSAQVPRHMDMRHVVCVLDVRSCGDRICNKGRLSSGPFDSFEFGYGDVLRVP